MSALGTVNAFELVDRLTNREAPMGFPGTAPAWGPKRITYNESRMRHIGSDFIVQTPELLAVQASIKRVRRRNAYRSWGRNMVLVSGRSGAGKTTALVAAARQCIAEARAAQETNSLPVIFIDAPANATAKSILRTFLTTLGIRMPRTATDAEMQEVFTKHARELNPKLIIVDELHNLANRQPATVGAADLLKLLSNELQATFIYSGVNIHLGSLMSGEQGIQLAGRSEAHILSSISSGQAEGRAQWMGLLRAFESQLALEDHPVGSLGEHAEYLFRRTGGSIGSLRQLLVDAALEILEDQQAVLRVGAAKARPERIELADLEILPSDLQAQSGNLALIA